MNLSTMLEGLFFYEIILLGCGALLFIAAFFGIFIKLYRGKGMRDIFVLVILSILMMGFSAIQKVSYDNGAITLEKFINDPTSVSKEEATAVLAEVERRVSAKSGEFSESSVKTMALLAKANQQLGNYDKAQAQAVKVLEAKPKKTGKITSVKRDFAKAFLAEELKASGGKTLKEDKKVLIEKVIQPLRVSKDLNAEEARVLTFALNKIGKKEEALKTLKQVEKVGKLKPKEVQALRVKIERSR